MSGKKRERAYLKRVIPFLLNIIYPSSCKICGKKLYYNERILCNNCISELDYELLKHQTIKFDELSFHFSVFYYENIVKDFIHLFKYQLYQPLGKIITEKCFEFFDNNIFKDYDFLQAVPLTSKKRKKRGFNQTELIAKIISKKTEIPLISIIKKTKDTISQSLLSKTERGKNLKGVFSLIDKKIKSNTFKGKSILIIDDVLTTGTTFKEIRKTLLPLEFSHIDIFTLSTPKI